MRRVNFVEDLVQDVRYTIRSLATSPVFTGVVVGTTRVRPGNAMPTSYTSLRG
jgi:hypothetical protein